MRQSYKIEGTKRNPVSRMIDLKVEIETPFNNHKVTNQL